MERTDTNNIQQGHHIVEPEQEDKKKALHHDWFTKDYHLGWVKNWHPALRWVVAFPLALIVSILTRWLLASAANFLLEGLSITHIDAIWWVVFVIVGFISTSIFATTFVGAVPRAKRRSFQVFVGIFILSQFFFWLNYFNGNSYIHEWGYTLGDVLSSIIGAIFGLFSAHSELKKFKI